MLDGTLCEGCGVFMGEDVGFARLCKGCAQDRRESGRDVRKTGLGGYQDVGPKPNLAKTNCPICNKRVKKVGLGQHKRDAHGIKD